MVSTGIVEVTLGCSQIAGMVVAHAAGVSAFCSAYHLLFAGGGRRLLGALHISGRWRCTLCFLLCGWPCDSRSSKAAADSEEEGRLNESGGKL